LANSNVAKPPGKVLEGKIQVVNFDRRRRTQTTAFLNRVRNRQKTIFEKKEKHAQDDQFREDANAKRTHE